MPGKHFHIDNNFLNHATRVGNEKVLHNWWSDLQTNGISEGGSSIQLVVTPFILLEAVGIRLKAAPQPLDESGFENHEISDVAARVYDHGYANFSVMPELTADHIELKLKETLQFRSQEGVPLFTAVIHNNLQDKDFVADICQSLALDYLLQYRYPPTIAPKIHQMFWLVLNDNLDKAGNLSFFRVVKRMWEQLPQKGREELFGPEGFLRLSKSLKMGTKDDFVDTELIHFAVVGKAFSGRREPLEIFTMDGEQTIRDRIAIYKTVLRVIRERFEESGLPTTAFDLIRPGKVHIYGADGKRMLEIDVATAPELGT